MATKTFETAFHIGAKFTGAPAFAAAHRAVSSLSRGVKTMGVNLVKGTAAFGKHVGAITSGILGSALVLRGFQEVHEFLGEGIDLARESNTAYEDLLTTLGRIPYFQKAGQDATVKQAKAFQELAEKMEETGLDAEVLMAMFKGGAMVFNAKQIYESSGALQDLATMLFKTTASEEQAAGMMNLFTKAIRSDMAGPLVKLGILTKDQAKHFKELKDDTKQAAYVLEQVGKGKWIGEMARQSTTLGGVLSRQKIIWDNIKKAIGQPFIDKQKQVTESFNKIGKAMEPIAGRLGLKITESLDKFAKMLEKDGDNIVKGIDAISDALGWIINNWEKVTIGLAAVTAGLIALNIAATAATAIGLLSNPIGWVILGLGLLGAAIAAVIIYWDDIKAAAQKAWETISNTEAWQKFEQGYQKAWAGMQELWTSLIAKLTEMKEQMAGIWEMLPLEVKRVFIDPLIKMFEDLPSWLAAPLQSIYNAITSVFANAYNTVVGWFGGMGAAANNAATKQLQRGTSGGPGTSEEDLIGPMPEGDADQNALIPDAPKPDVAPSSSIKQLLQPPSMKQKSEGTSPTNITMNPVINIHGVPAGQEGAVGREVRKAMEDENRNLETRLTNLRSNKLRTGYV